MSSSPLWQSLLAIMMMVAIGYGSRILGLLIMARIPLSPNIRLFIDAMSSSVLIAIITPIIVHGDGGTRFAALMAGAVAIILKSPLASIAVGIICAASWRWWFVT
ncbi:AzlD domain-containing protein [Halomonas sp. FME1]|uniref:AzlD domain-containing protein n=2 Tax=Halomonadaceae TaxID=28256 RepID=A0ABR9F528_9GAMM|nr:MULTISPECIES: AzlD domain-containing protein [Halomonas]MBE0401439.1 AzlD domain-containing protein [Halomonas casei]PCC22230.1 branched-chain amino acid transporter [Halomonas sp. JB37]